MSQNFVEPKGEQAVTQQVVFEALMNTMYPILSITIGCDDPNCECGGHGTEGPATIKDSLVN